MHTRWALMFVVAVPLTVALWPWLPGTPDLVSLLVVLGVVLGIGTLIWEPIYHGLQQFRWEKDWPLIFGLLTAANEGLLAYIVLGELGVAVAPRPFIVHFGVVWITMWLVAAGPMRVVSLRWRYQGGRVW